MLSFSLDKQNQAKSIPFDFQDNQTIKVQLKGLVQAGQYDLILKNENGQDNFVIAILKGSSGLSCWNTNGNGNQDINEDLNQDGLFNALDCKGVNGMDGIDGKDGDDATAGKNGINSLIEILRIMLITSVLGEVK